MDTRDHVRVQPSEPDIIVVSSSLPPSQARPTLIEDARGVRPRLAIIAIIVLLAAAVGIAIAAVVAGNDDSVAKPQPQKPADVPAPPAALSISAAGPASITAGQQATFTVTYVDGSGIFSGTSEEWGDGVGTSSLREGQCSATAEVPGSLSDSYQVTHQWIEPGTYSVVLGVHSYTCRGTTSVQEKATTTVLVKVLAR
jgi:hypothetical protein